MRRLQPIRMGFLPKWLEINPKKGLPRTSPNADMDRTAPADVLLRPYVCIRKGPPQSPASAKKTPTTRKDQDAIGQKRLSIKTIFNPFKRP